MQIFEHGQEHERTLLFFPCTAEPVWVFEQTVALLSRTWHVFQAVYDGHQPEYPGDFGCGLRLLLGRRVLDPYAGAG